jgi:hypothetical protein
MSNVAVVGASPDEERYSNKAMRSLEEKGHTPIPVAPNHERICGAEVHASLHDVPDQVDTVSMYVSPARQAAIIDEIAAIAPRRVIFNPGAENPEAYARLEASGVEVVEACTLVLLKTDQF